jgi:hypothetical protein
MHPDNHQFSSDYLNQIATPVPVKKINPLLLWGLIGGLLLLAVIVIVNVASSGGTPTASLASVGARLSQLQKTSESAQKNIQSSELRSINSSLTLALTNANHDMAAPLKKKSIKLTDKKNSTIAKVNKDFASLDSRLEDARLNAVYDRTYAREMSYIIKTLESDMAVLYKSTNSKSVKDALTTTNTNLVPLGQGFDSFNGS